MCNTADGTSGDRRGILLRLSAKSCSLRFSLPTQRPTRRAPLLQAMEGVNGGTAEPALSLHASRFRPEH